MALVTVEITRTVLTVIAHEIQLILYSGPELRQELNVD